jgi:hypothetical protein
MYEVRNTRGETTWCSSSLSTVLSQAVADAARTGEDSAIVDGAGGHLIYDVECDTKVDDEDVTFPVIVHTRAIVVGENA